MRGVRFSQANLRGASLSKADLRDALLTNADVAGSDWSGADLRLATLTGLIGWHKIANLKGANLFGVRDAPKGFIAWAIDSMGAMSIVSSAEWRSFRSANVATTTPVAVRAVERVRYSSLSGFLIRLDSTNHKH
jgi:uncharacterized protein YjbI with pentapeptide repeats